MSEPASGTGIGTGPATAKVLADLVDALLAEGLLTDLDTGGAALRDAERTAPAGPSARGQGNGPAPASHSDGTAPPATADGPDGPADAGPTAGPGAADGGDAGGPSGLGGTWDPGEAGGSGAEGERWARVPLGDGTHLAFRARPALFPRSWRLSRPPVLLVGPSPRPPVPPGVPAVLPAPLGDDPLGGDPPGAGREVGPGELVRLLATRPRPPGPAVRLDAADLVAADLDAAAEATAFASRAEPSVLAALARHGLSLRAGERLTALRDRPFHPLGLHKRGWSHHDARRWGPHARRPFGLDWYAVPGSWLAVGPAAAPGGPGPAEVLDPLSRAHLAEALADAGLAGDDGAVVPVHPWQSRHEPAALADAVPLAKGLGRLRATASLRTVVPVGDDGLHLKLPLSVAALGAGRSLPLRYLRNGDRAQRLLETVVAHPALGGRVWVCDESSWWVTTRSAPPGEGTIGAQLRRLPPALVGDPQTVLVPLAALGVTVGPTVPALAGLLEATSAAGVLAALTTELVRMATVCLAHGVMPEAHGHNVVVVLRRGAVAGLVLRDLDTVRVHPPWLAAAGLPDPGYVVDGRTPDTLAPDTPEGLLGWFQMLGVHVGLHPVALALGTATGLDEAAGWRTIAAATRRCLDDLAARGDLAHAVAVARRQLLERRDWPIKLVMGPLLAGGADCGTSMPSAVGHALNPLLPAADGAPPV